jgi:hypothetical protein
MQTECPYIQTSSQEKLQSVHPHTATCHMALDLTFQLRWAPALSCVIWLWTSAKTRLSAEVGSDNDTCSMAPDLASRLRWAPVLPRATWLWTSPSG